MPNLPPLHVLAAVLLIDPLNPNDDEDLEAAALLLARRIEHDAGRDERPADQPPRLRVVH